MMITGKQQNGETVDQVGYGKNMPSRTEDKQSSRNAKVKRHRRRQWKKPKGMPKRPLSAYNIFFAEERKRLLEVQASIKQQAALQNIGSSPPAPQKLGFGGLARAVASKWKTLDPETKGRFQRRSNVERLRYRSELKDWEDMIECMGDGESSREEISAPIAKSSTRRQSEASSSMLRSTSSQAAIAPVDGFASSRSTSMFQNQHSTESSNLTTCTLQEIQVSLAKQMLENLNKDKVRGIDGIRLSQEANKDPGRLVTLASTMFSGLNPASKASESIPPVLSDSQHNFGLVLTAGKDHPADVSQRQTVRAAMAGAPCFTLESRERHANQSNVTRRSILPKTVSDEFAPREDQTSPVKPPSNNSFHFLMHALDNEELEYITKLRF